MPSAVAALQLDGLTKEFRLGWRGARFRAVDRVSLQLAAGEVLGLLGPNGCGKSTTIKLITGLMRPTAGTCRIFGHSADRLEARRRVGYLPEPGRFHGHLTGEELVWLHARVSGLPKAERERRVDQALITVGLAAAAQRRVMHYSTGMLRRVGLAQALVADPPLLILDEPTAGVDPQGTAEMLAAIRRLKDAGKTVLLTCHLLEQIGDVCDRVAVLDHGRLMFEGGVRALLQRNGRQSLVVDRLEPAEHEPLRAWLAERGCTLHAIENPRARLDDVLTGALGVERDRPRLESA